VALTEVQTDEGISAYGAAEAMWGWGAVHKAIIESMLKPACWGKDPFATEQHYHGHPGRPGRAWMVENALWDIIGKSRNMPILQDVGGFQNRVRAYAAGRAAHAGKSRGGRQISG